MDWSYKECTVTITTAKNGARFRSIVKILRPRGKANGRLFGHAVYGLSIDCRFDAEFN